ncbi:cysteine--tRNA ligase [Labilibaculum euxinus]|uniref:Cysteine--tRNA ligase n=1 Tax=Labilibaculum euxinus TaxID=2686357 RepID=A0A7M4D436_9BACT|nr:cysteine--tRNA ligase [Labilibaculum euxinus]MUP37415.1 cysteine--tRNA ligase [Labilibaculum euxinus]MVB06620.1 cysteine--tRNA ligase [Labilibaculum euxinus]
MENKLFIYNTLNRKKELFEPINAPHVGLYVCGPTVYGDAHLGHARPAITFDLVFRYLMHLGYKVRYVRNITDVGHLVNDADEGEDKIAKKARLEQLEPMEIVQFFTDRYHNDMDDLNVLKPSIEPRASGHIIEQMEVIDKLLANGFAYESEGSVYFDVKAYSEKYDYGKLSGRKIEELLSNTRDLEGQSEKKNSFDFALWKKATPEHIMRWPSKWSDGFPGWHLECSAMSQKYLGAKFDIHGGGLDLQFPHHECEIAQSTGANGHEAVKYWMHNNMITINGQKMGKSLGNYVNLSSMFSGENDVLEQAYSPMTVRFFMLQAHYRSPLDFSNDALQAAEKGFKRLMTAVATIDKIQTSDSSSNSVGELKAKCYEALNDDFNTPILIAHLFDGVKMINSLAVGKETITASDLTVLKDLYHNLVFDVLGLKDEGESGGNNEILDKVVRLLLSTRDEAKKNKDWATADKIRNELTNLGIVVKDTKDGYEWEILK